MTEVLITIIGVYWLLAGVRLLAYPNSATRILDDFENSEALMFLTGIIILIAGVACLMFHNLWGDWREILVTLLLWGAAIEGALMLTFPKALFIFARKILPGPAIIRFFGLVIGLVGMALVFT